MEQDDSGACSEGVCDVAKHGERLSGVVVLTKDMVTPYR
jgi:hypothetical protein